jgi:hypothetical protein
MAIEGGCYCGEIRYVSENPAQGQLQCHCRECQYFTGGNPNAIMVVPDDGFRFTKGAPASFARGDLERPVTRLFCPSCGTAIGTRSPARPGSFIIKIGTLDDPSVFQPQMAIFTIDQQPYHHIPTGIPTHDRRPV